ncbi:MAG TPA: glycosyltransferase family 4 protein [Candidatus Sulfotelmatobacter sp.]|nr:glycosyltransferase family 4 protein [Candidatus Sulfotelmatobacter sp.]
MDKVRVLFLPWVDAGNVNAQSLNVREIALRLSPERFLSTVLCEADPDPRLCNKESIRILRLPARRKTLTILKEMLRGHDIIAYVDYSPASYVFVHLPRALRKKATTVLHAEAPVGQLVNPSRTLRFLFDGVISRCDTYAAITDFVARDLKVNLGKRVSYILPVGVDTSLFSPPKEREHRSPVVLFAGTLIERKGPQLVLEAAAAFPNATFRLVGASRDGYEQVLQRKIAQLNLNNVHLEGARTQFELLETMRQSDIFLLPSRLEGIPKVTLEAAATGLPCIVFRDYETPSVIDGITGFQVGTFEEMLQALGRLIADRELRARMGDAARKHVQSFDWQVVARKWQDAYLEIASQIPR